ncbi:MAG: hypothetical protein HY726_13255 [Candidatus Rokubacteria bacterium]|nr:hypothetical protein [Candidatus Rokubacteria bacterium]
MTSIEDLLAQGLNGDTLMLHASFQGLPGMAHGGSVLAAFDSVASRHGAATPREIFGAYRRKVPLSTPLRLDARQSSAGAGFSLSDGNQLLVDGWVRAAHLLPERPSVPGRLGGGSPLPISNSCFACGIKNPLGLQVALRFDAEAVWAEYVPRQPFSTAESHLATAALTTLLDETAFWLGALVSGESGMTSEIRVTLHRTPVKFGERLIVIGRRERVIRRPDDSRYWETEAAVLAEDGSLLATSRITFVAVRGAAKRLVTGMLSMNPPEVVRRVFPAHLR